MAKKILVVVDPASAEPQPVVERAGWLAEKTGAAVELFACDYDVDVDAGNVASVPIPDAATRFVIGSTAERVLDRLPCGLVIVKPAGFEPPPEHVRGA